MDMHRELTNLPFSPVMNAIISDLVYDYTELLSFLYENDSNLGYGSTRQGDYQSLGWGRSESMLIGEDLSETESQIEGWDNSIWTIAPWREMIESEFNFPPTINIPPQYLTQTDLNLLQKYGYQFGKRFASAINDQRQFPQALTRESWFHFSNLDKAHNTKTMVCRKLEYVKMNDVYPEYRHKLMMIEKTAHLECSHTNIIITESVWTKYKSFDDYSSEDEAYNPNAQRSQISFMLIFMERANGHLEHYLNNYHNTNAMRVLNENEAHEWFTQILSAIEFLHSRSITHMNIKPRNVMYTFRRGSRVVKLRDFSCAHIATEENVMIQIWRGDDQRFMPPETRAGNSIPFFDPFIADVYSLGKLLVCLMSAIFRYEVVPYNQLQPPMENQARVTEGLYELITEMCSENVQQRYTLEQIRLHPWIFQQNYRNFELETTFARPWSALPFWEIADPDPFDFDNTWWDNMQYRPDED